MKKTSNFPKFVLAALSCFSFMLSGCNNNSSNNDNVTIILSKKSTTLVVGAEQTLKAITSPKGVKVTWTSSDSTTVSVSDIGRIKAEKVGSATITATVGSKSAECLVTVEDITITISMKEATIDISESSTLQLSATDSRNMGGYTWESSNTEVATVDQDGLVTAKGQGSATITVSKGNASDTCALTVKAPEDYYLLEKGKNGDVFKNPGHWYYFSSMNDISGYHANGKAVLENKANKSGEHYLRYLPKGLKAGDIVSVSFEVESSVDGLLRFGATTAEDEVYFVPVEANVSKTITIDAVSVTTDKPFNITMAKEATLTSFMSGPYTLKVTDLTSKPALAIKTSTPTNTTNITNKTISTKLGDGNMTLVAVGGASEETTWESSNTDVATVNNGVVTPVSGGVTIITAKNGELSASVTVNVIASSLTLSKSNVVLNLEKGIIKDTLVADVKNVEGEVTWTSSNNDVVTVNNGEIQAVKGGYAVITATVGELSQTCEVVVISNENKFVDDGTISDVKGPSSITTPGWYRMNVGASNGLSSSLTEGVIGLESSKVVENMTGDKIPTLMYMAKDENGNKYQGKYFMSLDITNNTDSEVFVQFGVRKGKTTDIKVKAGETVTIEHVFNCTSEQIVNFKLKSYGIGAFTFSNVHYIPYTK